MISKISQSNEQQKSNMFNVPQRKKNVIVAFVCGFSLGIKQRSVLNQMLDSCRLFRFRFLPLGAS